MTKTHPAPHRKVTTLVSLLLIPFLLSGCFKFTMDLEVSSQDTISGTAVVALSKELQALAQGGGEEPTGAFADLEGTKVTEFDDGTFVGQQYEFSRSPIEDWALDDDSSALTIQRDGDNLVVSGSLSFEDEEADPEAGEDFGFGQAFFDSADLRVSIKFPGKILETNGDVNEETNTITWRPKYGQANELNAVVYAPRGIPIWVWWVVGAVLAIFLIVAGLLFARSRRRTVVPGDDSSPSARGSDKADSGETTENGDVGLRRTDRPVFSYQVKSGPFAKEAFELRLFEDELDFGFVDKFGSPTSELVVVPVGSIENSSVLEGRAGLGVRLVHSGKVEMLPAKMGDAKTLVSLVKSLRVNKPKYQPSPKDADDVTSRPTAGIAGNAQPTPTQASVAEDIRQFHGLFKEGALSEAEFKELKKRRIEQG